MTDENTRSIYTILGGNNFLLIIPHGRKETAEENTGSSLAGFGRKMAKELGCYAVINNKYKQSIINCYDLETIKSREKVTKAFLLKIKQFKDEISGNGLLPHIFIFQVAEKPLPGGTHIFFGYGQGERGNNLRPHNPSFSPSLLGKFRVAIEDNYLKTEIAPPDSPFCGNETHHINQLFRQKNFAEDFFDPEVRSLLLTLSPDLFSEPESVQYAAKALASALKQFSRQMSLVRQIKVETIDIQEEKDFQYIFRIPNDSEYSELARESYIEELAASIERNGLLHPLVLLQKENGRYKILCGYRRFSAIKRLDHKWVEAKIFQEQDFNTEDFFNISLAENTRRRNLNPVEIGNFLESASQTMKLNNTMLAERFGETLGIGTPGRKVSHSTIHKYRKVYQIRARRESASIINDIINEKLPFAIAAEILAPIKNPADRDSFYLEVVKPLAPTRLQLQKILTLLQKKPDQLKNTINSDEIQGLIATAMRSDQKAPAFINLLQKTLVKPSAHCSYAKKIKEIRSKYFGPEAEKKDFNIKQDRRKKDGKIEVSFRITKDNYKEILNQLTELLDKEQIFP